MSDDPVEDPERDDTDEPTDRRDPFDELGDPGDRDGDPFEYLGGPDDETPPEPDDGPGSTDADRSDSGRGGSNERVEPDPFEYMGDEQRRPGSGAEDSAGPEAPDSGTGPGTGGERRLDDETGDPLGDVAAPGEDPFETPGGVFEQVDVGEVDPDEVWDRLTGEPEPDPAGEGEDDVVDVSKHSFCEGCEHFSAPPDVHCTHEGTEILEFVDVETVRVANCPVVVERRELGSFEDE